MLLEEDAFLLAFLQSFVDFRNGQRQGVGDVAPACGSLQVTPILHPPFVIPQEGIIDLDSLKIPSFLGADRPPPNCLTQSPTPLKVARESPDSHK